MAAHGVFITSASEVTADSVPCLNIAYSEALGVGVPDGASDSVGEFSLKMTSPSEPQEG